MHPWTATLRANVFLGHFLSRTLMVMAKSTPRMTLALLVVSTLTLLLGIPSLADITLDDIAIGLDSGHFTCVDLVQAYLARTQEVNDEIHAIIETNPEALVIAAALDREISQKGRRGRVCYTCVLHTLTDSVVRYMACHCFSRTA
jgi:hypothetical protein